MIWLGYVRESGGTELPNPQGKVYTMQLGKEEIEIEEKGREIKKENEK